MLIMYIYERIFFSSCNGSLYPKADTDLMIYWSCANRYDLEQHMRVFKNLCQHIGIFIYDILQIICGLTIHDRCVVYCFCVQYVPVERKH